MSTLRGRFNNQEWVFPADNDGRISDYFYVTPALLQDIRDELRKLNRVLSCKNFLEIPYVLQKIERNTRKKKKKKKTRPASIR